MACSIRRPRFKVLEHVVHELTHGRVTTVQQGEVGRRLSLSILQVCMALSAVLCIAFARHVSSMHFLTSCLTMAGSLKNPQHYLAGATDASKFDCKWGALGSMPSLMSSLSKFISFCQGQHCLHVHFNL